MTTTPDGRAAEIQLFSLGTVQMRTFHLSWFAFFICFFAWFAHAPLLPATIGPDLGLSPDRQITAFIASVGITILARPWVGSLCDRVGPRLTYVGLLLFGAVAVAGSAFADSWPTYLFSRLCLGVVGASFVITQYHTTVMFAPNVVGTANATSAGWGNLGGGVTQLAMPALFAFFVAVMGLSEAIGWRAAILMVVLRELFHGVSLGRAAALTLTKR